jgi:hypothetical protein
MMMMQATIAMTAETVARRKLSDVTNAIETPTRKTPK